jgi:hypothetical protein
VPKGETEATHRAAPVLLALFRVRRPPWRRRRWGAADPVADVHIPLSSLVLDMVGAHVLVLLYLAGLFCVSFSGDGAVGASSSGEVSSASLLGRGSRGAATAASWRCVCLCLYAIRVEIWASPLLGCLSKWPAMMLVMADFSSGLPSSVYDADSAGLLPPSTSTTTRRRCSFSVPTGGMGC